MEPRRTRGAGTDAASNEPRKDVEVTELVNGDIQVQAEGEVVALTVDHSTDSAKSTVPDATETAVELGGFATPALSTATLN